MFFCWVQRGFVRDERLAGATRRRGGMDSNDQTKGKEEEEEEQGELLASIEAESSHLETELKGLMRLYVLMLFQRERKGELVRVEKKQKELNACLGELRRARDFMETITGNGMSAEDQF